MKNKGGRPPIDGKRRQFAALWVDRRSLAEWESLKGRMSQDKGRPVTNTEVLDELLAARNGGAR
jgi:hypothetical protein